MLAHASWESRRSGSRLGGVVIGCFESMSFAVFDRRAGFSPRASRYLDRSPQTTPGEPISCGSCCGLHQPDPPDTQDGKLVSAGSVPEGYGVTNLIDRPILASNGSIPDLEGFEPRGGRD